MSRGKKSGNKLNRHLRKRRVKVKVIFRLARTIKRTRTRKSKIVTTHTTTSQCLLQKLPSIRNDRKKFIISFFMINKLREKRKKDQCHFQLFHESRSLCVCAYLQGTPSS